MSKNGNKQFILAVIWITFSEFIRNEIFFRHIWVDHFDKLRLVFNTLPVNGALWTVWAILLAFLIRKLLTNFSQKDTFVISWLFAFLMMWIPLYNLQVLPMTLLTFAIPLSILEIFIAIKILN